MNPNPYEEDTESGHCFACGRRSSARRLDAHGMCPTCRRALVRRSTFWARVVAFVVAFAVVNWIAVVESDWVLRFLVGWLALFAVIFLVLYKIARRMLFDVFLRRSIPAPR